MLKRRGVIALLEPKRTKGYVNIDRVFQVAAESVTQQANALIFENSLAMTIDEIQPGVRLRARFMTLRSKDSSPVWYEPQTGLTPISIPPGTYIADVMHLIIVPSEYQHSDGTPSNSSCIIFDRHDKGPTLGDLSRYLNDFLHASTNVVSLYNSDLKDDLESMRDQFRKIDIGFSQNKIGSIGGRSSDSNGLIGSIVNLKLGERIPRISMALGMGHAKRDAYLPADVQEDAMLIAENAGELVERMKIFGRRRDTGKIEEINILRQRVGEHVELAESAQAPTMPDPADAYAKLEMMFSGLKAKGLVEGAISARFVFRT